MFLNSFSHNDLKEIEKLHQIVSHCKINPVLASVFVVLTSYMYFIRPQLKHHKQAPFHCIPQYQILINLYIHFIEFNRIGMKGNNNH